MKDLQEKFTNMHLLSRDERIKLTRELEILKPEFLKPFVPKWWWFKPCVVNVLIVTDGGLNFDTGGSGLSEFLTTFNRLETESSININYRVTLAHRGAIVNSPNPVVVNHISNFNFATSVNLNDFDQVWLFGISSGGAIGANEVTAIENYMNGGGGLFATGDHGSLGRTMGGSIPRVRDMRFWDNTPLGSTNDTNEVSMNGRRRNDTNKPRPGNATATSFDHQSDEFPQRIAVRTFGNGMPHPLLSINTAIRPSGIIDIMPDHPHEGECTPETSFTVNGVTVSTQIIATSFVPGGNTSGTKAQTDPHCFPSISVFDGRLANVGRIVIDSTWHHFVNINLNGAGSSQPGLTNADFDVVQHYYMNIARWMTRRKFMLCMIKLIAFDLFKNSQLIEASLNEPNKNIKEISLADLSSIGALAEEVLATKYNPAFARTILLEIFEEKRKELVNTLNVWQPKARAKDKEDNYYQNWINTDLILWTSIGAGFIALRDDKEINSDKFTEKSLDKVLDVFAGGLDFGFTASVQNLSSSFTKFAKSIK
jgi:hypothetical protein